MPKRFTETLKWSDKWFRALRPEFKLAWLYVLDNCDQAGVLDVDHGLADFQIGTSIDWDGFMEVAEHRIEPIGNGKIWVCRFIEYQYGELSADCRAHSPAFQSIEKHGLNGRVSKGYPKGIQRDKVKDKDKDKVKDKDKETEGVVDSWVVPESVDSSEVRALLDDFAAMRRRTKRPIKSFADTSRIFTKFDDADHLAYALTLCIANEWQGVKPDYRQNNTVQRMNTNHQPRKKLTF